MSFLVIGRVPVTEPDVAAPAPVASEVRSSVACGRHLRGTQAHRNVSVTSGRRTRERLRGRFVFR
jgi:hypothetical protein